MKITITFHEDELFNSNYDFDDNPCAESDYFETEETLKYLYDCYIEELRNRHTLAIAKRMAAEIIRDMREVPETYVMLNDRAKRHFLARVSGTPRRYF